MSTKLQPGAFDCYRAALPDEPMFILLARDVSAPHRLREWADQRRKELITEKLARPDLDEDGAWIERYHEDMAKCREADLIGHDMTVWRAAHEGEWRKGGMRSTMSDINPALRQAIAETTHQRLCSFLVVGTGSVHLITHAVRSWTMPGFNVRVHELHFDSASEAFAKLTAGQRLELSEWSVSGFDVALGDVESFVPEANTLYLRLQTVEAA